MSDRLSDFLPDLAVPDDKVGLGDGRRRQRLDVRAFAVLGLEIIDIAEVKRALRAGRDTLGELALHYAVDAGVALRHLVRLFVKNRRAVRAGLRAHAAADALRLIDQDESALVVVLGMGLGQADLDAGWIAAVVAGHRNVAVRHVLMPLSVKILPNR